MLFLRVSKQVEVQISFNTCFALQHNHLLACVGYRSGLHTIMGSGGASTVISALKVNYEVYQKLDLK